MSAQLDHIPSPADAETDQFDDEVTPEALNLSATLFWLFAAVALALLPLAVAKGRRDLGWVQEPWSWPFIVLAVALLGGAVQPLRLWGLRKGAAFAANLRAAFDGMGRSFLYAGAFLIYLGGVALLGFSLASLIFMQALYWLSGLRGGKWPWVALAVTLVIVLAFRVGLDIWFPYPPFLRLFPDWVAGRIGGYL
jgi:hypothetical protein